MAGRDHERKHDREGEESTVAGLQGLPCFLVYDHLPFFLKARELIFLAGYPDSYLKNEFMSRAYSGLNLTETGFLANYLRILEFSRGVNARRLSSPFDRSEFRNVFPAFEVRTEIRSFVETAHAKRSAIPSLD